MYSFNIRWELFRAVWSKWLFEIDVLNRSSDSIQPIRCRQQVKNCMHYTGSHSAWRKISDSIQPTGCWQPSQELYALLKESSSSYWWCCLWGAKTFTYFMILPLVLCPDYCRLRNLSEWFNLQNFSECGQFGIIKVGCIIPAIRISTLDSALCSMIGASCWQSCQIHPP